MKYFHICEETRVPAPLSYITCRLICVGVMKLQCWLLFNGRPLQRIYRDSRHPYAIEGRIQLRGYGAPSTPLPVCTCAQVPAMCVCTWRSAHIAPYEYCAIECLHDVMLMNYNSTYNNMCHIQLHLIRVVRLHAVRRAAVTALQPQLQEAIFPCVITGNWP